MKEIKRKCFKCEASPENDPETKLYRFPKPGAMNVKRCQKWAKYCCPDEQWMSVLFHKKLFAEHRMLCHRHFEDEEFFDYHMKKLHRNANPSKQWENNMNNGVLDEETFLELSVPPHFLTPLLSLYEEKALKASRSSEEFII